MEGDAGGHLGHLPPEVDAGLVDRMAAEVAERRAMLLGRIAELTDREVRVVAVTKGHPPEAVLAARAAGFRDLGENYAQEMLRKIDRTGVGAAGSDDGVRWHFVGRLQSNKVRQLAPHVHLWQSIDRRSLIRELTKRSPGAQVLVQVDLAGIEGRGGADPADVPGLVEAARAAGLDVRGLMGVAGPGGGDVARRSFASIVRSAAELGLGDVSIGMSGDMEDAVVAGATIVRVGTALFGPRPA